MTGLTPVILFVLGGAFALGVCIALFIAALRMTGGIIKAITWLVAHLVGFVVGVLADATRIVGAAIAALVAIPFAVANVILGRWPKAERWGRALRRETLLTGYYTWSMLVRRPLRLLCLDGVTEGVEERLPRSDLPTAEVRVPPPPPVSGVSEFEGYRIEGGLRPGGSGAKLYVAAPEPAKRSKLTGEPQRVVIKSFALEEGSSLPQIVRESRALDAARALGLVLDHGLDARRFWYVMPYHAGVTLNEATRLLHARSGVEGLSGSDLEEGVSYVRELISTLVRYHEGGLWHKDVKPDNMIVHDGRAHLVDLGLVTPLRSAMTLTTHGTEYFRDPEMVRQALRGVRVHEVDGVKFDVYGAGAVLYFVLENTFPAHGGLSAFSRKSPEALRWIVRRAMADYHQRYASAEAMLSDLEAVANARDPWSVRPIDLPSMGAAAPAAVAPIEGRSAVHGRRAASPVPPAPPPAVGRPRLVVTDWWRGGYASPDVAEHLQAARAGRAAVDAAQQERRPRPKRERSEPPRVAAAIGIMLLTVGAILAFGVPFSNRPAESGAFAAALSPVERAMPVAGLVAPQEDVRLLVVNTHPAPADAELEAGVAQILDAYAERGFILVCDDSETAAKVAFELVKARSGPEADPQETALALEAALAAGAYWGALHVDGAPGAGSPVDRLVVRLVGEQACVLETTARESLTQTKEQRSSRRTIRVRDSRPAPNGTR